MDENRKPDQENQELESEMLEQVSGGGSYPIKKQFCSKCRGVTVWICKNGVWTCGSCIYGSGNPSVMA